MQADVELDSWRRHWQADTFVLPDLKELVERETRRMRRFVVGEIIVTMVFGGGSLAWALLSRRPDVLVLAIGIWLFIASAWTLALRLRRGAWAPVTATTKAFLDLAILRCRRRREALMAQSLLYALIVGFDLAWIFFSSTPRAARGAAAFLTSGGVVWVWVVTLVLGVALLRHRRTLARELQALTSLRHQIEEGNR
jgi:hypothetical protein